MKINFIANIFGSSGYARHARSLVNALYELNPDISLDTPRPAGYELMVNDAERNMLSTEAYDDGVTVFIGQPQYWQTGMNLPHKRFYGFVIWEGEEIPPYWISSFIKANGLLIPSLHVRNAIEQTINNQYKIPLIPETKFHLVPHGTDPHLFTPQPQPEYFTFVANKGWSKGLFDRGGIQYLLQAYTAEFRKEEPVQLVLKINPAYAAPGWNLQEELRKLGVSDSGPRLKIKLKDVPYEELPAEYAGHVFVSPTRAEAFNIPCLEAMSAGLPVITTNYGGQTDFVTEENGWLVPYSLVPVETEIAYEHTRWAVPDLTELRRIMRYVYEHRAECLQKGKIAREHALKYTWRASAEALLKAITI